jgi:hypothetical protein
MTQITLRAIEPEIEKKIRKMAKERQQSINTVLNEILREKFHKGKRKPASDSLRALAGGWTQKQALEFEKAIEPCEQIDEGMWS